MGALEGYRELPGASVWVGDGVFVVSLAITGLLEWLQLKLRANERRRWWASNGRDVLNALALAAMALGLFAMGFSGPVALVVAAVLLLLVSASQTALGGRRLSGALALGVACVLGAPVLIAPRIVDGAVRALLERLF